MLQLKIKVNDFFLPFISADPGSVNDNMFFDEKIAISELAVFKPDFTQKKSVFVPGRNFHALTYRISGSVSLENGGNLQISKPGSVTFVPRGLSYNTEVFESGSMYVVHFQTFCDYSDKNLPIQVINPSHPVVFNNFFSELAARFKVGRENDLYCMSMFYGILAETKHEIAKKSGRYTAGARIRYIKEKIDRGFADPLLSVSVLANDAGISEVYFRREFGKCYGMPPNTYIKKVRIENAKAYLRTGYYSVTETATRCGFDSISYFSYEFRRVVGITPRQYADRYS